MNKILLFLLFTQSTLIFSMDPAKNPIKDYGFALRPLVETVQAEPGSPEQKEAVALATLLVQNELFTNEDDAFLNALAITLIPEEASTYKPCFIKALRKQLAQNKTTVAKFHQDIQARLGFYARLFEQISSAPQGQQYSEARQAELIRKLYTPEKRTAILATLIQYSMIERAMKECGIRIST